MKERANLGGDFQHSNTLLLNSFTITWFSVTIRFENLIVRKKSNHRVAIRLLPLNETS